MSQPTTITLEQVKAQLRTTHDLDDELLERLLAAAQQECLRFLGRRQLPTLPYEVPLDSEGCPTSEEVPSSEDPVAPDVATGIILMIQADYEGDPAQRQAYRDAAEGLWMPYRIGLGV